ncbi:hypothetical protein QE152_g1544 [Popillia japonica]|uniref:Uncharacterized protein n=1 Tax=Popillia japonica TaxID=7064 RepID=A0AAW1N6N6_POPJA
MILTSFVTFSCVKHVLIEPHGSGIRNSAKDGRPLGWYGRRILSAIVPIIRQSRKIVFMYDTLGPKIIKNPSHRGSLKP